MRRFINRISLFAVLPLFFVGLVEISYLNRPVIFHEKRINLENYADSVEILFLGNSQILNGIIPEFFSEVTFNGGLQLQSPFYSNLILQRYAFNMPHLKRVVVNISYPTLFSDFQKMDEYAFYYGRHWNLHRTTRLESRLAIFSIPPEEALKHSFRYYFFTPTFPLKPVGNTGFYIYRNENGQELELHSSDLSRGHNDLVDVEMLEGNMSDMTSLVETTEKLGVELVILRTPEYESYLKKLDQTTIHALQTAISELEISCGHCRFLDYSDHDQFKASDFYDAIHLNETGAAKLSQLLVADFN